MGKFFKKFVWLWEMIGAALILALGIVIVTEESVLLVIVGTIFLFLGILRFIPLMKTTEDKVLKWVYGIELFIDILAGGVLMYLGISNPDGNFMASIKENFGYIIAAVVYLRGFAYFFAVNVRREEQSKFYFYVHIFLLTLGALMIGISINNKITLANIKWVIFAIAILSVIFVSYAGYKGYMNYRHLYISENTTKKVKRTKKADDLEAPTSDEIGDSKVEIDGNHPSEPVNEENRDEVSV